VKKSAVDEECRVIPVSIVARIVIQVAVDAGARAIDRAAAIPLTTAIVEPVQVDPLWLRTLLTPQVGITAHHTRVGATKAGILS